MATKSIHGYVSGKVQGVWFRAFVQECALRAGVTGYARNLPDSKVEFLLQGDEAAVEKVLAQIYRGPELSRVDDVAYEVEASAKEYQDFATF